MKLLASVCPQGTYDYPQETILVQLTWLPFPAGVIRLSGLSGAEVSGRSRKGVRARPRERGEARRKPQSQVSRASWVCTTVLDLLVPEHLRLANPN